MASHEVSDSLAKDGGKEPSSLCMQKTMLVKTEEKAFGPLSWDETRETLIHGQYRT